jgi:hypothetical protein
MKCQFCHNEFSNKQNLNAHQKKAKYCLKIQGIAIPNKYQCKGCNKTFEVLSNFERHKKSCKHPNMLKHYKEQLGKLKDQIRKSQEDSKAKIALLENTIKELREDKKQLQDRYDKLSLTAVKRPTVSNKTMYVNNLIKNMQPLTLKDIESSVPMLTLEHHTQGAEGYAQFALEFPFKDKIVCVDVSRNKIKYKNDEGDIIEDVGFRKMMIKLCKSLKDRSFSLSIQHIDKLSADWSEKEREAYDFMEAAVAISTYAQGRENEFCSKIIRLISKGSNSKS